MLGSFALLFILFPRCLVFSFYISFSAVVLVWTACLSLCCAFLVVVHCPRALGSRVSPKRPTICGERCVFLALALSETCQTRWNFEPKSIVLATHQSDCEYHYFWGCPQHPLARIPKVSPAMEGLGKALVIVEMDWTLEQQHPRVIDDLRLTKVRLVVELNPSNPVFRNMNTNCVTPIGCLQTTNNLIPKPQIWDPPDTRATSLRLLSLVFHREEPWRPQQVNLDRVILKWILCTGMEARGRRNWLSMQWMHQITPPCNADVRTSIALFAISC